MSAQDDEATYRAGTPRTEAEARAMLAAVEPVPAAQERRARAEARSAGHVMVWNPGAGVSDRVPIADWPKRWRGAPVPALTKLVPRCEGSGVLRLTAALHEPIVRRARRVWDLGARGALTFPTLDELFQMRPLFDNEAHFVVEATRAARPDHTGPLGVPRGWCAGLTPGASEAQLVTDPTPLASIVRVYPKPSE